MNNRLAFGNNYASISTDANFLATQLSKIVPSLEYLESANNKNKFLGKNYNVNINELKISASYMSSTKVYAKSSAEYTLMIPIKGNCITTVENNNFSWGENSFAYCKTKM